MLVAFLRGDDDEAFICYLYSRYLLSYYLRLYIYCQQQRLQDTVYAIIAANAHNEIKDSGPSSDAFTSKNFLAGPMSVNSEPYQRTDISTQPLGPNILELLNEPQKMAGSKKRHGAAVITSALADSAIATDGKGTVIENNGSTKSGEMTIAGYSVSSYRTELHCALNSLPAYCSGSPVTFSGLPPGKHLFTTVESINDQTIVQYFGWEILE